MGREGTLAIGLLLRRLNPRRTDRGAGRLDAHQIKQFQDYWDTEFSGDLARRRRAKFVPGETAAHVVQTKEPEHKDDFDEWLARIICYAFVHDPEKWNPVFRKDHAHLNDERNR